MWCVVASSSVVLSRLLCVSRSRAVGGCRSDSRALALSVVGGVWAQWEWGAGGGVRGHGAVNRNGAGWMGEGEAPALTLIV